MNDLSCWETKFKYCCYSKRLLTKLLLLNKTANTKIDILEIKKAIYYARKYHGDQKRESGEPYYLHPIEVAYLIADYSFKTDILVTSILHDTIEDTEITKKTIDYVFGSNVANYVDALTRIKTERKISVAKMIDVLWVERKNDDLLLIKYFDRLHNMQTINFKPHVKAIKTVHETFEKFLSLSFYFKDTIPKMLMVHEAIMELCYKQLAVKQPPSMNLITAFEDNFLLPSLIVQNAVLQTKNL